MRREGIFPDHNVWWYVRVVVVGVMVGEVGIEGGWEKDIPKWNNPLCHFQTSNL